MCRQRESEALYIRGRSFVTMTYVSSSNNMKGSHARASFASERLEHHDDDIHIWSMIPTGFLELVIVPNPWATGIQLPGEDKASCTNKEQCGRDDIYDKHKKHA